MKDKINEKLRVILYVCIAITTALVAATCVYVALRRAHGDGYKKPTAIDTDSAVETPVAEPITETSVDITTEIPPGTESKTDTESENTDHVPDNAFFEERLDEKCREIIKWVDENTPVYKNIETADDGNEVSNEYQPPVAFYYLDLESGRTMKYNEERVFFGASVIKAPYVMYALKEIETHPDNEAYKLDNIFTYTEDRYKEGSGVIQRSEFGTQYSYKDILRLSVTQSDNVAFAFVRELFPRTGFNAYSETLGVKTPQKNLYKITAAESAIYLEEIYKYFESGSDGSKMLREWMSLTNHRIMIPNALKPTPVAHKYGWDIGAYHDTAVVFDEHPYVLVILTELDNGSGTDNKFIRGLADRINTAHTEVWNEYVTALS